MSSQDIFPSTSQLSIGGESTINVGAAQSLPEMPDIIETPEIVAETLEMPEMTNVAEPVSSNLQQSFERSILADDIIPPSSIDIIPSPETPTTNYMYYIIILIVVLGISALIYYFIDSNYIHELYQKVKSVFIPSEKKLEKKLERQEKKIEKTKAEIQRRMDSNKKYCFLGKNENGKNICAPVSKHRKCQSGKLMYASDCANI